MSGPSVDPGAPASRPSPPARRVSLGALAVACAAAGGWFAWVRLRPTEGGGEQAVALLAGLSLPDAQGAPYALSGLTGKTVVLNFWATWCPPCVEEMPELADLHREIESRQALVIGIGIDSPSNIREFASKQRFPYPLLVGGMGGTELARQFGNASGALPFTVVINPKGQVTYRRLGRIRLPELRKNVLSQLA